MVSNVASALGEAVGKLFETAIVDGLQADVQARGHIIKPARLENGTGNVYQIDAVVFDSHGHPIVIVDPKYIRYKKHNRDKGSWLCVAHYNLRKTFPTIRKSIAVLAGRWSAPSKALIESFGVHVIEVPFETLVIALKVWGVDFDWSESDRATPQAAWRKFSSLSGVERSQIATDITSSIMSQLKSDVLQVLDTDVSAIPRQVVDVEVLLKTSQNEMVLSSFGSVTDAIKALTDLVLDKPDIGAFIKDSDIT